MPASMLQSVLPRRGAAKRASSNLTQQLKPLSRRKSAPERLTVTDDQMSIDGSTGTKDIDHPTYGISNGAEMLSSSSTTSDDVPAPVRRTQQAQRTYGGRNSKGGRPSITKASSEGSILSTSSSLTPTPAATVGDGAPSRKRARQSDATEAELGTVPKRKRSFVVVTITDLNKHNAMVPQKPKPKPKPKPKAAVPVRSTTPLHHPLNNSVAAPRSRTAETERSPWCRESGVGTIGKRRSRFGFV